MAITLSLLIVDVSSDKKPYRLARIVRTGARALATPNLSESMMLAARQDMPEAADRYCDRQYTHATWGELPLFQGMMAPVFHPERGSRIPMHPCKKYPLSP